MKINKIMRNKLNKLKIPAFFLFFYSILIYIYISSLGLMDDFYYTSLNFFQQNVYFNFVEGDIRSGGLRPLLPFQIQINNIGYILFNHKGYFLFNLVYLVFILEFFYIVFNKFFKLNKYLFYIFFFSWPYSSDLIIHPSLQEKYIILFLSLFIHFCFNEKYNLKRTYFTLLLLPLIKIQSLIFFPLVIAVSYSRLNSKHYKLTLLSIFSGTSLLVLGVFAVQPKSYFNSGINISNALNQLLSAVNLINFIIIFLLLGIVYLYKIKNVEILIGLVFSNILLIIFMSAYRSIGNYLNSINIFFIIIFLLIIYDNIIKNTNFGNYSRVIKIMAFIFFLLTSSVFTIPRFERMHSIDDVMEYSSYEKLDIYYSCLEGVSYLNKFQVNNNYIHLDSYEQVADQKMVFLSDNFECNNIEDSLELECEVIQIKNFKYENSMKIIEYQC